MQKIPVFQTAAHAYGFAFGRYLSTLSIIWLPFLLLCVLGYFLVLPALGNMLTVLGQIVQHPQDTANNTELLTRMQRSTGFIQLFNLIQLAISVMIFTGITKEALGTRTGSRFYYLQFGKAELNVFVAFILMVVIIFGVIFAMVIAGAIVGIIGALLAGAAGGDNGSAVVAGAIGVFVGVAAFCVSFYILARALYLIVPASVAEEQIAISRSWQLARGNVLRIFAICVLVFLPILIAEIIAFVAILGPIIVQLVNDQNTGGQDAVQRHVIALMGQAPIYMLGLLVVGILVSPIVYGLIVSAPVFAYRALVPAATKDAASHF